MSVNMILNLQFFGSNEIVNLTTVDKSMDLSKLTVGHENGFIFIQKIKLTMKY